VGLPARGGIEVAKSTVKRLMRSNGWQGVRRQRKVRTTVPDPTANRVPDPVERQFRCPQPTGCSSPTSLTSSWSPALCSVAFVIDAYAGMIIC
jgi:putative transposase